MSGYAPNPTTAEAAASLTSGLLARKGQATPAVDAMMHEGVDVDLDTNFASRPKRRVDADDPIEAPRTEYPQPAPAEDVSPAPASSGWRPYEQRQRATITLDAAPENWTVAADSAPKRPLLRHRPLRERAAAVKGALRATVKFRMPATDFMRLRAASRAMKESCQIIILDAITAYLDANEVEPVDEETARREAARLAQRRNRD